MATRRAQVDTKVATLPKMLGTEVVSELQMKCVLVGVVLFGSYAQKRATKGSDIDLLIVVQSLPASSRARAEVMASIRERLLVRFARAFDVVLITKEEMLSNVRVHSPLFCTLALGIEIWYDTTHFCKQQLKILFEEMTKEQLQFGGKTKVWDLQQEATSMLDSPVLS